MEDCSTDERLQQETLCHRQWTDEYVERPESLMRQNVVVVWIQCLLVDVVRHAGTLAPDHVGIRTTKLRPCIKCKRYLTTNRQKHFVLLPVDNNGVSSTVEECNVCVHLLLQHMILIVSYLRIPVGPKSDGFNFTIASANVHRF